MTRDYDRRLTALEHGIETDDSEYSELLDRIVGRMVADGENWIRKNKQFNDYATTEELAELKRVRPINGSPRLDRMVKAAERILKAAMDGPKSKKDRVGEDKLDIGGLDGFMPDTDNLASAPEGPHSQPQEQSVVSDVGSPPVAKSTVPRHPWATAFE